ncbi:MAG: hypothetical protein FWD27_02885 [Coriobacteriia bacterium]|nr:hypothetical protein [Coriobacteriia bacterium]
MKQEEKKQTIVDKLALVLRVLTVPPILVAALLVFLYLYSRAVIALPLELVLALTFLVLIPLLAYPISYLVPKFRTRGREGQRNLALVLSLTGYSGAVLYGIFSQVSSGLLLIFLTYLLSVLTLLFFNKVLKIRASGHACGTMGPLVFPVYFAGIYGIIPCILVAVAVAWSSLRLGRHSVGELIYGAASALVAFIVSLTIVKLVPAL